MKVCAMSSHLGDQDLVQQLVDEHADKIIPAFGLHPWWSHHISFDSGAQLDKLAHYQGLFPDYFNTGASMEAEVQSIYDSFPVPTSFDQFVASSLMPHLIQYPDAILGEVGLDRSFRIPFPQTDAKSNRAYQRTAKKFTNLKVPFEHQKWLLLAQVEVAFELNRNVSMHCVQAQGAMTDILADLPKISKHWSTSKSKICLHSFGGSVEVIQRLVNQVDKRRIYFSFSTTINAKLDRLEELIRAVPDDRILVESDFNDIRQNERRIWEILGVLCDAKGWDKERGAAQLRKNWQGFTL